MTISELEDSLYSNKLKLFCQQQLSLEMYYSLSVTIVTLNNPKVFNKSDVMRILSSQYKLNRVIYLHEIIVDVF